MLYLTAGRPGGRARLRERGPSAASPAACAAGAVEPLRRARARARDRRRAGATRRRACTLEPGDAVVLYTDGLLEARREGELYGEERLDDVACSQRRAVRTGAGRGARWPTAAPSAASSRTTAPSSSSRSAGDRPLPARRPACCGSAIAAPRLSRPRTRSSRSRLALELGCDLVEFDVHDVGGTLLLVHDRPSGDVEGLPTLDEALAFLAGTGAGVHLDLKARDAEEAVSDALRRHGLIERTVVSSFRPEALRALARVEPGLRLGLTYPQDRTGLAGRRLASAGRPRERGRAESRGCPGECRACSPVRARAPRCCTSASSRARPSPAAMPWACPCWSGRWTTARCCRSSTRWASTA